MLYYIIYRNPCLSDFYVGTDEQKYGPRALVIYTEWYGHGSEIFGIYIVINFSFQNCFPGNVASCKLSWKRQRFHIKIILKLLSEAGSISFEKMNQLEPKLWHWESLGNVKQGSQGHLIVVREKKNTSMKIFFLINFPHNRSWSPLFEVWLGII